GGRFAPARVEAMSRTVGKTRLVLDLSCRFKDGRYYVVTERFQRFTDLVLNPDTLVRLGQWCAEFLVHAVDAEGLACGVDEQLVLLLAEASPVPATYAGGAKSISDLERVTKISNGRVDLTIGSALDIFGGTGVRYVDCVEFNRRWKATSSFSSGIQ
ncbi:MAG: HisA/HisF-related TIM barrel protein, partial [Verrucomicrobiae bacterium]|nr:HisA/HisF-related TIM barrel protein [Verrucomicrobiae bacterium]